MDKKLTDINIKRQDDFNRQNIVKQENTKFKYPIFSSIEIKYPWFMQ